MVALCGINANTVNRYDNLSETTASVLYSVGGCVAQTYTRYNYIVSIACTSKMYSIRMDALVNYNS